MSIKEFPHELIVYEYTKTIRYNLCKSMFKQTENYNNKTALLIVGGTQKRA